MGRDARREGPRWRIRSRPNRKMESQKREKAASARANTKKLTAKAGVAICKRKCIRSRFWRESLYLPGCPSFISKSSSAHACRTLRNEELRKTYESGAHQAQQRGNEMTGV